MKIRLDQYLCQNGYAQSRERAKALIMSGIVFVNEQKVDKAGEMIAEDAKVEVRGHDIGYVSRGGLKLEKAMQVFPMRPDGKVCMDIGASTGGFTDCMLKMAQSKCTPWMWAMASWRGACAPMSAWSIWSAQTSAMLPRICWGQNRVFQRGCFLYLAQTYLPGGGYYLYAGCRRRLSGEAPV